MAIDKTNNTFGTLPDFEIKTLCERGKLIESDYSAENVKQACYELRASNIYYDLADNKQKYVLKDGEYILLKPKQLVVIITLEKLNLDSDILGRILTKGKLFSLGILPVNTYADPGFKGNLGIVLYNLSNNYLKIYPNETIAKIEFSRLYEHVEVPYNGQHGYQTNMWLIPEDNFLTGEEIKNDNRIKSSANEILLSYGKNVGNVINRVFRFERYLIFAAIVYLFFSSVLIVIMWGKPDWLSPLTGVILGVISNIIFSALTYFSTSLRDKFFK